MSGLLATSTFVTERMAEAADSPYAAATDLAEFLVERRARRSATPTPSWARSSDERSTARPRWPNWSPRTPSLGEAGAAISGARRVRDPPHHPRRCRPGAGGRAARALPGSPRGRRRPGGRCLMAEAWPFDRSTVPILVAGSLFARRARRGRLLGPAPRARRVPRGPLPRGRPIQHVRLQRATTSAGATSPSPRRLDATSGVGIGWTGHEPGLPGIDDVDWMLVKVLIEWHRAAGHLRRPRSASSWRSLPSSAAPRGAPVAPSLGEVMPVLFEWLIPRPRVQGRLDRSVRALDAVSFWPSALRSSSPARRHGAPLAG